MKPISKAEIDCDKCSIRMKKTAMKLEGFKVRAWQCPKCNDTLLHPEDTQRVLVFNKLRKGIPVKVGSLGRSLIMRIPKEVAVFYNISKGNELVMKAEEPNKLKIALA